MNGDLKVNPEGVWAAIFLILATFAILATNIQLVADTLVVKRIRQADRENGKPILR